MRLHLTTSSGQPRDYAVLGELVYRNHLLSFSAKRTEKNWSPVWEQLYQRNTPAHVIIDSGAFTAWSSSKAVDLGKYAAWAQGVVRRWQAKTEDLRFVNLDVIPGRAGHSATAREVECASIESLVNADVLRTQGLNLMEVFHQDEPFSFLDILLARQGDGVLCLSPRNDVSVSSRVRWLRQVLRHLLASFMPASLPRCHGLAATARDVMTAFPFYSVDSASWVSVVRFGKSAEMRLRKLPRYTASLGTSILALRREVEKYQRLEASVTKLWATRGVTWND